jgi:hypothetical protein
MMKTKCCPGYRKRLNAGTGEGLIHMSKWKLRSCPRCDGDMFTDTDLYGLFEQCLQCGYASYSRHTVKSDKSTSTEKEEVKEGIQRRGTVNWIPKGKESKLYA